MKEQDNKQIKGKAAWISLLVSALVMAGKFIAFFLSGSQAIYSDAAESIVNVVAAILALVVIKMAMKPADGRHPYGHGKMEFFSAAFEGGLIAFAACTIFVKAVESLFVGEHPGDLGIGLIILSGAALVNLGLGLYLRRAGEASNSKALLASSAHVLSDLWTSVGIVVGLLLYMLTGWHWIDPAIAIVVAIFLVYTGFEIVRDAFADLLDARDEKSLAKFARLVRNYHFPGMIQVHHVRILRSGAFHHIDAHLVVPQFWDVAKVHSESERFAAMLMEHYEYRGEICFHLDPCRVAYCASCDYEPCSLRTAAKKHCNLFSLDELESTIEPDGQGKQAR